MVCIQLCRNYSKSCIVVCNKTAMEYQFTWRTTGVTRFLLLSHSEAGLAVELHDDIDRRISSSRDFWHVSMIVIRLSISLSLSQTVWSLKSREFWKVRIRSITPFVPSLWEPRFLITSGQSVAPTQLWCGSKCGNDWPGPHWKLSRCELWKASYLNHTTQLCCTRSKNSVCVC